MGKSECVLNLGSLIMVIFVTGTTGDRFKQNYNREGQALKKWPLPIVLNTESWRFDDGG